MFVSPTGIPDAVSEELVTDENGIVIDEELPAPDVAYSLEPGDNQPYSEYNVLVNAPGYNERFVSGVQIFPGENGIQNIELTPEDGSPDSPTVLDAHTLWAEYPPKIAEDIIKPVNPSGGIVLSRVVVPETIVVHDGAPTDPTAKDYYVPYKDYIKKCRLQRDIFNLARCRDPCKCPGDTVIYLKPCVYRMVQRQGL